MATIVIKDLPDNVELDREGMIAIKGGMRARGRQTTQGSTLFQEVGGISRSATLSRNGLADGKKRVSRGTPNK